MTLLLLLDLSAAFDTVDYGTLLYGDLKTPLASRASSSHGSNLICLVVVSAFQYTVHSQEDSIWSVAFRRDLVSVLFYSHSTPVDCFRLFRRICLTFIVLQMILNYIFPFVPMTLLMTFLS